MQTFKTQSKINKITFQLKLFNCLKTNEIKLKLDTVMVKIFFFNQFQI